MEYIYLLPQLIIVGFVSNSIYTFIIESGEECKQKNYNEVLTEIKEYAKSKLFWYFVHGIMAIVFNIFIYMIFRIFTKSLIPYALSTIITTNWIWIGSLFNKHNTDSIGRFKIADEFSCK